MKVTSIWLEATLREKRKSLYRSGSQIQTTLWIENTPVCLQGKKIELMLWEQLKQRLMKALTTSILCTLSPMRIIDTKFLTSKQILIHLSPTPTILKHLNKLMEHLSNLHLLTFITIVTIGSCLEVLQHSLKEMLKRESSLIGLDRRKPLDLFKLGHPPSIAKQKELF